MASAVYENHFLQVVRPVRGKPLDYIWFYISKFRLSSTIRKHFCQEDRNLVGEQDNQLMEDNLVEWHPRDSKFLRTEREGFSVLSQWFITNQPYMREGPRKRHSHLVT